MRGILTSYIPFAFTALLCGVVVAGTLSGNPGVGLPAFYCFLPMSFFYLGGTLMESSKQVRALEEKVKMLESSLASRSQA